MIRYHFSEKYFCASQIRISLGGVGRRRVGLNDAMGPTIQVNTDDREAPVHPQCTEREFRDMEGSAAPG